MFQLIKIIWKPGPSVYQHFHFLGVFKVPIDKTKKFKIKHYGYQLENILFWEGLTEGWEKESIKIWIKLCANAKIIIDIGANTGIYSLIAKAVSPTAKVYAFEPVSRVFNKLKENISINNFDIIAIDKAVSNFDGIGVIYDTPSEHTYSVTVNKNFCPPGTIVIETKIETITLNSFIKIQNIEKIDLIKIDVETHEPEVLEGFSEYLVKFRPAILIEILNDEIGELINKLVQELHYLFFNIDEKKGVRQVNRITKSDGFNYLLCTAKVALEIGLISNAK